MKNNTRRSCNAQHAQESLHDLGRMEEDEDQVNTFLHCCLCFLKDPKVASKLTQMLTACMKEQGEETTISAPLSERDVCPGQQEKAHWPRV
jgi:hypothetical protein